MTTTRSLRNIYIGIGIRVRNWLQEGDGDEETRHEEEERCEPQLQQSERSYYDGIDIVHCPRGGNHQHQQMPYVTYGKADEVVDWMRMRHQGLDPDGTLRSHYNPACDRRFVGNGRLPSLLVKGC